jgi:hypothetical protein
MRISTVALLSSMTVVLSYFACTTASPGQYFGIAVLNVNMIHGFAGSGMQRELASPSVKMIGNDPNKTEPMKRQDIVDQKIDYLEENLKKLNSLKETEDTREMLNASKALYNYVLPVYKTDYMQLAKLYDDGAAAPQIDLLERSIGERHYGNYSRLFDKLTSAGKAFAQKHNISVQWDLQTSPH